MVRCRWGPYFPNREGKREAMEILRAARSAGYTLWATICYEIEGKRCKFSDFVRNENWDIVKSAIERADRDIRIYDVCEGLNF